MQVRSRVITRKPSFRTRLGRALPWLPLAAIVAVIVLSMLGLRMVPGALAIADTSLLDVTGSVDKEVHLDATNCAGTDLNLGTLVPGDPMAYGSDCSLLFGTNNSPLGADLQIRELPAAEAANPGHAMKCVAGGCGANQIPDYQGGAAPAAGNEAFSVQYQGASGGATDVWAVGTHYDVQDAADLVCQTASMTDGTCDVRFGAMASPLTTEPGTYQASVEIVTLPR